MKKGRERAGKVVEGRDPDRFIQGGLRLRGSPCHSSVREAIRENPKAVESYREGDAKSLNFLMGQVMKKTQGKANPATVRKILAQELGEAYTPETTRFAR